MKFLLLLLLLVPSMCFADSQAENTISGYAAAPHIIQSGGTSIPPRPYLDFEGISCANVGGKTVCTANACFSGIQSSAPSVVNGCTYINSSTNGYYIAYGGTWQLLATLTPLAPSNVLNADGANVFNADGIQVTNI